MTDSGYVKAQSDNLPKIDAFTMTTYLASNPDFTSAEIKGVKAARYGSKYVSKKLPPWPLMVYDGLVYTDSCPGSSSSHNKHLKNPKEKPRADRWNNVFCLLLPPYRGEGKDPVHGGLLIDRGTLIALYLQEERRPSGPQSAQYTGVWRLLPWVLDVAREPEDLDSFPLDM